MKFLIISSPIIKFLINKYISNLSSKAQSEDVVRKFIAQDIILPADVPAFIEILKELQAYLLSNNFFNRIVAIRKLVGNGVKWKGLLNLLVEQGHEVYVYLFEPGLFGTINEQFQKVFKGQTADLRVITPLNLDETEEIDNYFQNQIKLPVYPLIYNFLTSKWLINFTFAPYAPRTFYFPDTCAASDFMPKVQEIAKKENITTFMMKDEYDFDLRSVLPYCVVPVSKLDQFSHQFYDKAKGICNLGGLVMEEFMATNNLINVYKAHIYGHVIAGCNMHYKILIKGIGDGASYDSIIDTIHEEIVDLPPQNVEMFNLPLAKYYPFIFSSVDFIMHNNQPKVIDLNGVAGSFSYVQKPDALDLDKIFNHFITHLKESKNDEILAKQVQYQTNMRNLYQAIRNLGPCYVSGDKLICLNDMSEKSVKKVMEQFFNPPVVVPSCVAPSVELKPTTTSNPVPPPFPTDSTKPST